MHFDWEDKNSSYNTQVSYEEVMYVYNTLGGKGRGWERFLLFLQSLSIGRVFKLIKKLYTYSNN